MPRYTIKDWAGNSCFGSQEFRSYEDAWEFLNETFEHLAEDDLHEQMSEFYIELTKQEV